MLYPCFMKSLAILVFSVALLSAQSPIDYEVRFPNAVHHEAEITVTWTDVPPGPLQVRMSRTSPGRYALHEFAKNVYQVRAVDGQGNTLICSRPNSHQWDVSGHHGTVKLTYTLFGDRADGTYAGIDSSHAHLNMPAAFVWARGMEERPVRVRFVVPEGSGWKIATQLAPTADPATFTAPDLAYFLDSPVELSNFVLREFSVRDGTKEQTVRVTVHHQGTTAEVDSFTEMTKKVVLEQAGVFGEFPEFDYGSYTFLNDYLPWVAGDGMEHRNSTYCVSTATLAESAGALIGTVAHEFFHAWNVERLRPRSLEPFDLEAASMPEELWFAEGFTSYYAPLTLKRAGLIDLDEFAQRIGGTLDGVIRAPGRQFVSPVEASLLAPFVDGARWQDRTNFTNTFVSYYPYGAAVGLGLDLVLRTHFTGLSLDDYMCALWEEFGRPEKPYSMTDLERTLGQVTGDMTFAHDYFARYVRGHEVVDYGELLELTGFVLRKADPDGVTLGSVQLEFRDDAAVVNSPPRIGTPIYEAGLSRGARITEIDGRKLRKRQDWEKALSKKSAGDRLTLRYEQRGQDGTVEVEAAPSSRLELVTFEDAGLDLTPEVKAMRDSWLRSKAIQQPR